MHKPKEKKTSALFGRPGEAIGDLGPATRLQPLAEAFPEPAPQRRRDPDAAPGVSPPPTRYDRLPWT
jgi:hypothetical protein